MKLVCELAAAAGFLMMAVCFGATAAALFDGRWTAGDNSPWSAVAVLAVLLLVMIGLAPTGFGK